jgi:hypothetical protein
MTFGVCIAANQPTEPFRFLLQAFGHYGFNIVVACSQSSMALFKGIQVEFLPFRHNFQEILDQAVIKGSTYIVTINDPQKIVHAVLPHINFIFKNDLPDQVVYEPLKPTSRSYDIFDGPTAPLKKMEPFIISLIEEGPFPETYGSFSDTYLFKSKQKQLGCIIQRNFPFGLNYNSTPKILPLWNFSQGPSQLVKDWSKFFTNFKLVDRNPSYYLVINASFEQFEPQKTIYFMMEPYGESLYKPFLDAYSNHFLFYGCHAHHLNNCEWHISSANPPAIDKIKGLSIVVSDRAQDPGQKYRLDVVRKLDQMADTLSFPLAIYGKCSSLNFKNYKGELPPYSKDTAINQYQYHFNAENNSIANYITEKLYDPYLCEAYIFYWGCPNVTDYFDADSLTVLQGKVDQDVTTIVESIEKDIYLSSLHKIKKQKQKILSTYAMDKRYKGILEMSQTLMVVKKQPTDQQTNDIVNLGFRQSLRKVTIAAFECDVNCQWLIEMCQFSCGQFHNLLIIFGSIDAMTYQKFCFACVNSPDAHIFLSTDKIGDGPMYIRVSGAEIILNNARKGLRGPNVLQNCKVAKI